MFQSSECITPPLVALIISQEVNQLVDSESTATIKKLSSSEIARGKINKLTMSMISLVPRLLPHVERGNEPAGMRLDQLTHSLKVQG